MIGFARLQQKPRERLSSNLIDLNSPPPDPNYVNDKSFDVNSNTTPPPITRDVFDMRMFCQPIILHINHRFSSDFLSSFHFFFSRQNSMKLC